MANEASESAKSQEGKMIRRFDPQTAERLRTLIAAKKLAVEVPRQRRPLLFGLFLTYRATKTCVYFRRLSIFTQSTTGELSPSLFILSFFFLRGRRAGGTAPCVVLSRDKKT